MPFLTQFGFDNYTFTGDIAAFALCTIMAILINTSYVPRTRSFRIFQSVTANIALAAVVNIAYHVLVNEFLMQMVVLVYILRVVYQVLLFDTLFLFALYITEVTEMERKRARFVAIFASVIFFLTIALDIACTISGCGFRITENGITTDRANIYILGYLIFVIFLVILMMRVHHLLYRRVMFGFYGTMIIAIALRLGQMAFKMSSFTTVSFVFPASPCCISCTPIRTT